MDLQYFTIPLCKQIRLVNQKKSLIVKHRESCKVHYLKNFIVYVLDINVGVGKTIYEHTNQLERPHASQRLQKTAFSGRVLE